LGYIVILKANALKQGGFRRDALYWDSCSVDGKILRMFRHKPAVGPVVGKNNDSTVIDTEEFDYNAAGLPNNIRQLLL
jgi:hypothetical protein